MISLTYGMIQKKYDTVFLIGSLLILLMLSTVQAEDSNFIEDSDERILISIDTENGSSNVRGTSSTSIVKNTLNENNIDNFLSSIFGSVTDNTGIININQSSGCVDNQSNVRAFYLSANPAAITKININKFSEISKNTIEVTAKKRQDVIDESFWNNSIVLGINQTAGNLNQQSNTAVMMMGGLVSLTDEELDNTHAYNTINSQNNIEIIEDIITDCFVNSKGIFQVTQAAGNVNIQENNLCFSFREINVR
jgi:hypothetical protein